MPKERSNNLKKSSRKNSKKKPFNKANTELSKKSEAKVEIKIHTLDASGQVLGRLATSVANLLRGKGKVEFRPHILIGDKVIITNASKIKVTGNKMISKIYWKHSGYIGNLKSETMMDVYRKNPSEILRRAVKGMLPKNKLQDKWMKNLTIYNGDING